MRLRGEGLQNSFYSTGDNDYEQLASRVLLSARWQQAQWSGEIELADARVFGVEDDAPLGTDQVNTLEPLQAYLAWAASNASALQVKVGRLTKDLGSRRLIARNSFRNTINAFDGLEVAWEDSHGRRWQTFAVSPIARLPDQRELLRDNRSRFDRRSGQRLAGLHLQQPLAQQLGALELYVLALREADRSHQQTRNRRLLTTGLRWQAAELPAQFDSDIELVLQRGRSRASDNSDDQRSLRHRAVYAHIEIGRRFDVAWQPRLALFYDYASGDHLPDDEGNQRFDTLYGARRWELGPTGIYGAIARANLNSPGARFSLQPAAEWRVEAVVRDIRLAARRDGFAASGLRDPQGNSGSDVGTHWEATLTYNIKPGQMLVELGMAGLRHGEFLRNRLSDRTEAATHYVYLQTVFSF